MRSSYAKWGTRAPYVEALLRAKALLFVKTQIRDQQRPY
jgi:hypothetical protein